MVQGFITGAFAPLHRGHAYLIEQAAAQCERLSVFVCSRPDDDLPGWLRYHWVKSSFPTLDVRHWIETPGRPDVWAYCREQGYEKVFEGGKNQCAAAESNGIQHITIDPDRRQFPVFSAEIRLEPLKHWDHLLPNVRPHYIRRVALLGPESCGKSFLAEQLAVRFNTVFVEEYGRTYCEKFGMDSTELDFAHVAGGQLYREDEMALQANRVLFCDTELIVTQVWSEVYFNGKCQPWIFWADHLRRYDLFLLLAPDIPWENDGLRRFETQRQWMFERLQQELECRGLPFLIIRGPFATRTQTAVEAVEKLMGSHVATR
ncbi:MAG: AAA family ATPase [Saprospiraceae bacterium]|nr:AAA family ATPase [Saprospiraceae bacterium]